MEGQLVCVGCGSDVMSRARVSLFRNTTLWPTPIRTSGGDTEPLAIVMVAATAPGPPVDGEIGDAPPDEPPPYPLPHAGTATRAARQQASSTPGRHPDACACRAVRPPAWQSWHRFTDYLPDVWKAKRVPARVRDSCTGNGVVAGAGLTLDGERLRWA
jgi:hypothetical protein